MRSQVAGLIEEKQSCIIMHRYPPSTEMSTGSKAGSYLRLIDFMYHSTLVLRVIQKREEGTPTRG